MEARQNWMPNFESILIPILLSTAALNDKLFSTCTNYVASYMSHTNPTLYSHSALGKGL